MINTKKYKKKAILTFCLGLGGILTGKFHFQGCTVAAYPFSYVNTSPFVYELHV